MKFATVLATSLLSFSALAAQATTVAAADGVSVSYADLALDRKAGIVTLYQRINSAARRVCDVHAGRTVVAQGSYATCVDDAIAAAVARIDRPMLTDYVARQSGKPSRTSTRVAAR